MKYTFDVDEKNNKFEIRLEITKTGGYNSTAAKTIECSEFNPNWTVSLEKLLVDIIDNMRLTVKERTEVYKNSNILTLFVLTIELLFKLCYIHTRKEVNHRE